MQKISNKSNSSANIHPGEVLQTKFLQPLSITPHALAVAIKVPSSRIAEIVKHQRSMTPDTAVRLAKFLGTSAHFWLSLQNQYDIQKILHVKQEDIENIIPFSQPNEGTLLAMQETEDMIKNPAQYKGYDSAESMM